MNTTLLNFSTTVTAEKAAFEITLMESMHSYFVYVVYTSCGITQIKLEGYTEDWELILSKTKALEKYDLEWWTKDLIPVLEKFVVCPVLFLYEVWNHFFLPPSLELFGKKVIQ